MVKLFVEFDNLIIEKVVVVVVKGIIVDGECKVGEIGGDFIVVLFCKVCLDDKVKVVVLCIDLGGGSMFVFEVIWVEVLVLKVVGKLVIVFMSLVVVLGGYWIVFVVNEIWVVFSIIIGLIGVFGMFMIFENIMVELGIYLDGVVIIDFVGFLIVWLFDEKMVDII